MLEETGSKIAVSFKLLPQVLIRITQDSQLETAMEIAVTNKSSEHSISPLSSTYKALIQLFSKKSYTNP
jgi:hypothetical protein